MKTVKMFCKKDPGDSPGHTLALLAQSLNSADIDIFRTSSENVKDPMLFVLDNSANWNSNSSGSPNSRSSTRHCLISHCVRQRFVDNPDFVGINIGILVYSSGNSPKGQAYPGIPED